MEAGQDMKPEFARPIGALILLLAAAAPAIGQESGREYYETLVADYGEVTTPRWVESVERVTDELAAVSEPLDEHAVVTVLEAPDVYNAFALDGGYIVVFSGFLEAFDLLIENAGYQPGSAEYAQSLDNLVAPLLAHEISHLLLHHHARGRSTPAKLDRNDADVEAWLKERELSREMELDADRLGALLMARAGYPLEAMYMLFRAFDELDARRSDTEQLSYFRSHPRPTDREANLDIWKGHLKKNQARIDDAVMLIENNMALDVAITLLDSALVYFPNVISLRHNRATAWHRVWLNTMPLDDQTPATSFALYAPDIIQLLRGEGDNEAYRNAVADYRFIIDRYSAPRTESQLAALLASRGDLADANALATRAGNAAPDDPVVWANLSAVHIYGQDFQAGYDRATQAVQILKETGKSTDYAALAPALYNLGVTARELGNAQESRLAFKAYAQLDSTSRYARIATGRRQDITPDRTESSVADAGPGTGALQFGATRPDVEDALGEPELAERLEHSVALGYPSRGLSVHVFDGGGILLLARQSFEGDVGGIRMGMVRTDVLGTLGQPKTTSGRGWLDYPERHLSIRLENGRVTGLMGYSFE